ncbi:GIY-YIG nuclease family protein [Piscinibacter sp.]|uniref:GIY-YIG nuclease family protein n=1 Tax=Piscinibacter sp. TaxID=1903157 RepID=UPI002C73C181|nr:GIY-YIG nuclease family protein [Albitalea sp.]HUG24419.1 GIY-YIG nuclease family protein [Albitalea sp.]
MPRQYFVYILASRRHGTLYIGSTSDLIKRVYQHKNGVVGGFTKLHRVDRLVWFEVHESSRAMVTRERQLKEWKRQWKIELIEKENQQWEDLYPALLG